MLCPSLDGPNNGSVSVSSTSFGGRALYSCKYGYRLSGSSYRFCLLSGEWSGIQPTCISKHHKVYLILYIIGLFSGNCGYLSSPRHGRVSVTTRDVGDRVTYTCNSGFRLIGSSTRTCLSDGSWSGSQPICSRMYTT